MRGGESRGTGRDGTGRDEILSPAGRDGTGRDKSLTVIISGGVRYVRTEQFYILQLYLAKLSNLM